MKASVPQNIEAEKSLLGCLLIDPDAILKVVDFLLPRDFYQDQHNRIYSCMVSITEKKEPIDVLSVSSKLKERNQLDDIGGRSYLASLVNTVPTASHISNYAKIVQQKRVLRELISAGHEIGAIALQEEKDVDELLDEAEKRIFRIAEGSMTQGFTPVSASLEETWARIDELSKQKGGLRGVPTGFAALDNLLAGLQKSDLIILAARPSLGKSSLAVNIAHNVASKYKIPVGIFSLEMSKDQIIDRIIATEADVDLWKLRTGKLSDEGPNNDFERIQKAMAVLAEAPIYIHDMSAVNVLQMRAMARRLMASKGLGLLIVDYLQLMGHRNPNLPLIQQVTDNSKALKGIAKEFNIPVLVLSQLSRAVEQRTPQIPRLSDLRDSGCLLGDTLIERADTGARIKIEDLVGQKDIPVHSLDKDLKIKEKTISKVFCSGEKMVYELKTRSGFKIKASANHPFLKKNEEWTRLDKLKTRDDIAVLDSSKNLQLDEIVSITQLRKEKVYDATVPETHNFVANNIIVHNSIEQDADVVAFIHREDKYKENTEKQGIADIIVAKHRNGPVGKIELYFDETRVTFRDLDKRY